MEDYEIIEALVGNDLYSYDDYSRIASMTRITDAEFRGRMLLLSGYDIDEGFHLKISLSHDMAEKLATEQKASRLFHLGTSPDEFLEIRRLIPLKKKEL